MSLSSSSCVLPVEGSEGTTPTKPEENAEDGSGRGGSSKGVVAYICPESGVFLRLWAIGPGGRTPPERGVFLRLGPGGSTIPGRGVFLRLGPGGSTVPGNGGPLRPGWETCAAATTASAREGDWGE